MPDNIEWSIINDPNSWGEPNMENQDYTFMPTKKTQSFFAMQIGWLHAICETGAVAIFIWGEPCAWRLN